MTVTALAPDVAVDGRALDLDVDAIRRDFPILGRAVRNKALVYLDNAATTQKPRSVIDAVSRYNEEDNANIHRGVHFLSQQATYVYERARGRVAHFLNAKESCEIVFLRGTTEAINLVAHGFGRPRIGAGDEIILTEMEHHSNIVPWQMLRDETGALLRVVPVDDDGVLILDDYERLLGERTRLVAVTHASNALGTINDGGPGYDGWAIEQGLPENAGFSDDASGDGFSNGYHYAMGILPTASILEEHRDLIPRIDPNLFANKATLLFKVPIDFPDDIILEVEESFDMQNWNSIATKDGNADWFFQFPNVVILDAPAEGYRGVGVTSTNTFSQPDPGYYRLRVRTPGIPVVVLDVEPESLQLDAFTLQEVRIDGRTLLVDVSYSGGCAEHDFQLYMSPATFLAANPGQREAYLWLQHEDNDDACDAIVSETLHFDLTPVLDLHRELFGRDGEITLYVFGFFEEGGEPDGEQVVTFVP